MQTIGDHLLQPTVTIVKWYSAQFSSQTFSGQSAQGIRKLLDAFPSNVELCDVLIKVATINALYATNIYAIYPVAQHILNLQIDARLAQGDLTLVHDIARIQIGGKWRSNYSFASKYCAWHVPETYAIYDSYVDWLLWRYQQDERFFKDGFRRYELKDYPTFMSIMLAFRRFYGLERLTLKEIDNYLWLYGQGVIPSI
jgi:hypothetical protein